MQNKSKTKLQILSQQGSANQSIETHSKLKGEVELNFKSDYFKLDNFKEILLAGKTTEAESGGEGEEA